MNELEIIYLPVDNWVKIILIICTILILIARISLGVRFQYFLTFWNIHRYFYFISGQRINSPTNISFIFLRLLTTAFLINYSFDTKKYFNQDDFYNYLFWIITVMVAIIIKYLLEKTISYLLKFKKKLTDINKYRIGIKNLFSIHLYLLLFLIIFSDISIETVYFSSIILICLYHLLYFRFIFNRTSIRTSKGIVYFILYLCTFEIAPIIGIIFFLK